MNSKITQKTIWKQTISQKVVAMFQQLEKEEVDIARTKTNDLIFAYYYRHGLSNLNRAHEMHDMINRGELPSIESVSRSIRKARSINKDWAKADKEETVEHFARETGYRDNPALFQED